MDKGKSRSVVLSVNAPLRDFQEGNQRPLTVAYAFSAGGRLLAQKPLDESGQGKLELHAITEDPTGIRVLVGPPSEAESVGLEELIRRGAVERHLRLERAAKALNVDVSLQPDIWRHWLLGFCLVKGTLLKRVTRDGVTVDFPVCHATVEIYEVDPFPLIIAKLPKSLLDRLRDVILRPPLPDPPPELVPGTFLGPGPGPGPGPDPGPFARAISASISGESHRIDAESIAALNLASGSQALRFSAMAASDQAFAQALIENAVLVRPLLCWLYPTFVTMTRVGTAISDDCGHFRTFIWKGILNPDQPDLYFKAKQRIFGFFDVTIYAPTPVACHTWWNYVCGTEVTLFSSHPLAITCSPCPPIVAGDNWVLFMAIGNFPLSRIHGTGQALGPSSATDLGLTDGGAPWGGQLRPRLEFDNQLRDSLGVLYYRLSWKRSSESDTQYKPLNAAISRHYAHMVGTDLVLDAYPLGPKTVGAEGNLFEIPPSIPPLGQWSIPDAVLDTSSGIFDTVAADGTPLLEQTVQIRVELFDAAGAPVNITSKGIHFFVPTSTDLSGTIHTVDAATLGLTAGNTMVITLHVNNEPCSAAISPAAISGVEADVCCGALEYDPGDTVTLAWQGSHPHGFASYSFGVVRGATGVFSQNGSVGAGSFSVPRSVSQLMNDNLLPGCPVDGCVIAGFSENLYVAATATDGWSRQTQYDRSAVRAFVLAPDEE